MKISEQARLSLAAIVFLGLVVGPDLGLASDLALSTTQYVDPKGFFRIVPPDGWRLQEFPGDSRGKVAFFGPTNGTDLRVLVNAVDFSTIDELVAFCRDVERRIGMNTHIERTTFGGRPAVRRSFTARGSKLTYIDFLVGKVDHNLAYSARISDFDKFRDVATASMETYEPVSRTLSDNEATQQLVDKKIRLSELMLGISNYQMAFQYAEEGLEVEPDNARLKQLRDQAKSGLK